MDSAALSPDLPPELLAIQAAAEELGLVLQACLPAEALPGEVVARTRTWLEEGRAGEMEYLQALAEVGGDPRHWKPWARSMLLFSFPYARPGGEFRDGGRIARYALGRDYHNLLGRRLQKLGRALRREGLADAFRAVVDAGPLMEREWAFEGRLGWRGKNTLLVDPEQGPWWMLAELMLDADLPRWTRRSAPLPSCGSCEQCLVDCPTKAFSAPYVLDPRLCISYWTIESKAAIPLELRPLMGDRIFGCDDCSSACPFGTRAESQEEQWGRLESWQELRLEDLLTMDEQVFHKRFTGSPLRRPGLAGMARNACVVLGNLKRGSKELIGAARHESALVRRHAVWALGEIGELGELQEVLRHETHPEVREEAEIAISR